MMNNAKLRGRLLVFAFALLLICAFAVGLPAAERTNAEDGTKKTLSSVSLSYQGQDNWYALTGDFDAGALYRMYRNNVGTAGGFGSWWQGYGNYANFIADQNYNCCYPVGSDAILAYVVPEYANVSLTGRIIGASARAIRTSVVYRRAGAQDLLLHSASVSNAAEEAVGVSAFHVDAGDVLFFVAETDPSVAAWDGVIFDVEISLTARSGRAALVHRLELLGYDLTQEELDATYEKFLALADRKKEIHDYDLLYLVGDIDRMKQQSISLKFMQVTTGTLVPTATVVLKFGDHERMSTATGNGPVDAAVSAIKKLINEKVVLAEFLMQAITRGSNDVGRVHVQVECGSRTVHGFGAHTDTTRASIEAFLDALRALNVTEKIEEED